MCVYTHDLESLETLERFASRFDPGLLESSLFLSYSKFSSYLPDRFEA